MSDIVRALSGLMDRAGAVVARFSRPIRDGLIIVGLARAAYYYVVQGMHPWTFPGVDARAYWGIDLAHPYVGSAVGDVSSYLYSPAFAQVTAPLSMLPFPVFDALWTVLLVATLVWLVRPWPWALLILFLPISYELFVGNVHFLIAAAIVIGFRRPAAWAFPILTKITPGVGLLWFVVRREWRALAIAIGVTTAVVLASFALWPAAWMDWITFLLASPGASQWLIARLVIAGLLVALGAMTDQRWLVAVAVWLSLPLVYVNSWVILLATIRLRPTARN
jgi:Glycosyltransferase family 87